MRSSGSPELASTGQPVHPRRFSPGQWLGADVALALASLVIAVANPAARGPAITALAWWQVALLVFATAPLPLRRVRPVVTFAVIAGAVTLLCVSGRTPYVLDATAAVAAYSVAVTLPRRRALLVVLLGEIALGTATAVGIATHTADGYFIHTMLAVGALGFAGDAARSGRQFARAVSDRARLQQAEEWERHRSAVRAERLGIARDLHDIVAHSLTVMTVQAGVGARTARADVDAAAAALESIQKLGRSAQDELRVVLNVLRDDDTGNHGTAPAPGFHELQNLVVQMRETGVGVESTRVGDGAVSAAVQLTVYRIAQEALTNVAKHSGGAAATVDLTIGASTVRLEVTNAAKHGASRPDTRSSGHGLIGMRERVAAFRGTLVAEATDDGGFRVVAVLPREAA